MGKKKKYPQRIDLPFVKGDFIRKRNNSLFNKGGLKGFPDHFVPAIKIKMAIILNHQEQTWLINNRYKNLFLDNLEIITEEKALELENIYKSLKLSIPENISIEETCFTTYTGERTEKRKFNNEYDVMQALYQMKMNRPNEEFHAYECPNCKFYHIGKKIIK